MFWMMLACTATKKTRSLPEVVSTEEQTIEVCDFSAEGRICLDQMVRVTGTVPKMVMNHPIISMAPTSDSSVQSYLDVGERQIIILSSERMTCSSAIEVSGLLKEIDLGGEEGTRNSYRNYYISESTIRCLP